MLLAVAGLFTGVANADEWRLQDTVTLSASTISRDNDVGADSNSTNLRATPSLHLSGKSRRTSANIRYGLSFGTDLDGSKTSDPVVHSLRGSAKSEIIENHFFLSGTAFAGLTSSNNTSASVDPLSPDNETIQTYSFSLSPEFRAHLARNADIVSRDSVSYFGSDRGSSDSSISRTAHIGVESGRRFSVLNWSVGLAHTATDYDTSSESVTSFDVGTSYRLNRVWSVNSGLGYSESDAPTSRSSNSAMNWHFGGSWRPNKRTSASARYGQNYSGNVWSGDISHRTRRTRFGLNFSRSLTNTATVITQNEELVVLDADGNPIVDPNTGNPLLVIVPTLVPTSENFINTQIGGSVTVQGRRTTVVGRISYYDRAYDVSGRSENGASLRLSANRRLSEKTNANVSFGASNFSSSNSDKTYDVRLGINRSLGQYSNVGANLSHRLYDTSGSRGYTEQQLSVFFSTQFL